MLRSTALRAWSARLVCPLALLGRLVCPLALLGRLVCPLALLGRPFCPLAAFLGRLVCRGDMSAH